MIHRWILQKLALWSLAGGVSWWLYQSWELGHGLDVAEGMILSLFIFVLGSYTIVSRLVMALFAANATKRQHRIAEFGIAGLLLVLWVVLTPRLQKAGFERNLSRAMSLGLVQDCEKLVDASPSSKATDLWARECPASIRALRPFRVVVRPPVVELLWSPGLDTKVWLVVDPAYAKTGLPSQETEGMTVREVARGIYFE